MTTIEIAVQDATELAERLQGLGEEWPELRQEAMEDALVHSGVLQAIWERTPKSLWQRYASQKSGYKVGKTGRINPKWSTLVSDKDMKTISEYGRERLARSLFSGLQGDVKGLISRNYGNETTLTIRSDVEYAGKVHEGYGMPKEGDYWPDHRDEHHGWSTAKTGIKYIEGPVDQYHEKLFEETRQCLLDRIEGAMS